MRQPMKMLEFCWVSLSACQSDWQGIKPETLPRLTIVCQVQPGACPATRYGQGGNLVVECRHLVSWSWPDYRGNQTCFYSAVQGTVRQGCVLLRLINMSLCHWMARTSEIDVSTGSRSSMIESVGILTSNKWWRKPETRWESQWYVVLVSIYC